MVERDVEVLVGEVISIWVVCRNKEDVGDLRGW
jgi:hypothetical protein